MIRLQPTAVISCLLAGTGFLIFIGGLIKFTPPIPLLSPLPCGSGLRYTHVAILFGASLYRQGSPQQRLTTRAYADLILEFSLHIAHRRHRCCPSSSRHLTGVRLSSPDNAPSAAKPQYSLHTQSCFGGSAVTPTSQPLTRFLRSLM